MKTITKIFNTKQKNGTWYAIGITEEIIDYEHHLNDSIWAINNSLPSGSGLTYEDALKNMIDDAKIKGISFNYEYITEIVPRN